MGAVRKQKNQPRKVRPKWTQALPVIVELESFTGRLEDLAHRVPPASLELRPLVFGPHNVDLEARILSFIFGSRFFFFAHASLAGAPFEGRFEGSAF